MTTTKLHIKSDWKIFLREELDSNNFKAIISALKIERDEYTIFPEDNKLFSAFNMTSLKSLKVVILGQDPYHQKGQAHRLSFSVPNGQKTPPSLRNIFKE